jgi:hypothetical protein
MTTTLQKNRADRKPKPAASVASEPITAPATAAASPEIRTRLVADCAWPTEATLPEKKRAARR